MNQAQVRSMYIKANPGVRRKGKKGRWYRCAHCGKWCGRAGEDKYINLKDNEIMEVDHIIPWSKAQFGADQLSNLQPLCRPCNRNKSNNQTGLETAKAIINTTVAGDLPKLVGGMLVTKLENAVGYKPKRK